MGIAIFFRAETKPNNFRNCLLHMIEDNELSKIIMTYPYISQHKIDSKSGRKSRYAILDTGLEESILKREGYQLISVSTRNLKKDGTEDEWTISYRNFVSDLKNAIASKSKSINFTGKLYTNTTNYLHAKFCIGYKVVDGHEKPVVLILGSSNLTNKTFELYKNFNHETDVILWDDEVYSFTQTVIEGGSLKPLFATANNKGDEIEYIRFIDTKVTNWFDGKTIDI